MIDALFYIECNIEQSDKLKIYRIDIGKLQCGSLLTINRKKKWKKIFYQIAKQAVFGGCRYMRTDNVII
ncbi:hypothetical protein ASG81_24255 [Paenibacillus sp. Soil522]|nr:hypothetical protein ASG81_24255 [Paenibacillus sp. Soil522]